MKDRDKFGMQCADFEALLADAIEGTLGVAQMSEFEKHAAACPECGPVFREAEAGLRWMQALEEVEPPAYLVTKILNVTSGATEALAIPDAEEPRWRKRIRNWLRPIAQPMLQPRFAMSFGMAFFSVSMLLSISGVNIASMKNLDLRPSAIRRNAVQQYYAVSARAIKYYENMRIVVELENRVRELRRQTETEDDAPAQRQSQPPRGNETTEQPKREQNYRVEQGPVFMAKHFTNQFASRPLQLPERRIS